MTEDRFTRAQAAEIKRLEAELHKSELFVKAGGRVIENQAAEILRLQAERAGMIKEIEELEERIAAALYRITAGNSSRDGSADGRLVHLVCEILRGHGK